LLDKSTYYYIIEAVDSYFRTYFKSRFPSYSFESKEDYYKKLCFFFNDKIIKNRNGLILTQNGLLFSQQMQMFKMLFKVLPIVGIENAYSLGDNIYAVKRTLQSLEIYRMPLFKNEGNVMGERRSSSGGPILTKKNIATIKYNGFRSFNLRSILYRQKFLENVMSVESEYYISFITLPLSKYHMFIKNEELIFVGFLNDSIQIYKDGKLVKTFFVDIDPSKMVFKEDGIYYWSKEEPDNAPSKINYDSVDPTEHEETFPVNMDYENEIIKFSIEQSAIIDKLNGLFEDGKDFMKKSDKYAVDETLERAFRYWRLFDKIESYLTKYKYRRRIVKKREWTRFGQIN
jgi:hypothetical protein